MQIAYLIVAHEHYQHLLRLVKALEAKDVHFFLHLNPQKPIPKELQTVKNLHLLEPQAIYWGAFSQVEVTLRLMRMALEQARPDYLVLLSGVDYPLRKHQDLVDLFSRDQKEYINILPGFQATKPAQRVTKYHFQTLQRRSKTPLSLAARILEKAAYQLGIQKQFSYKPFVGSNWFALSGQCVRYILNFLAENPDYTAAFKYSLCADEIFFHTIIGNSPFYQRCTHNLTYADWSVPEPPARIRKKHIEKFKQSRTAEDSYGTFEAFFARKFTDDSLELLQEIEAHLR